MPGYPEEHSRFTFVAIATSEHFLNRLLLKKLQGIALLGKIKTEGQNNLILLVHLRFNPQFPARGHCLQRIENQTEKR